MFTKKVNEDELLLEMINTFLKFGKNIGMQLFESINDIVKKPKELDELAELYSKASDQIITEGLNQGLEFYGGKFRIHYVSTDFSKVKLELEAYFQNARAEWIKKSTESFINNKLLTPDAYTELTNEKIVEYELLDPRKS